MKKTFTLFITISIITLFSFAPKGTDESTYTSQYIKYSVERTGGTALVTLNVNNLNDYTEIYLKRSTNPTDDFRQVKFLNKSQVSSLSSNNTIIDKYPLPGNIDTYYKVVAINTAGVYKLFPCVKLSRYN